MSDSLVWITFEAIYQQRLKTEPHLSRARFKADFETHMAKRAKQQIDDTHNSANSGAYTERAEGRAPQDDPAYMAVVYGWNDVWAKKTYQKAYETAPQAIQNNYEMGRALASICGSVQELHPWPAHMGYEELRRNGMIGDEAAEAMAEEHKRFLKGLDDAPRTNS